MTFNDPESLNKITNIMKEISDNIKANSECLSLIKDEAKAIKETLTSNQLTTIQRNMETMDGKIDRANNSLRRIPQDVVRQGNTHTGFVGVLAGLSIALALKGYSIDFSTASLSDLIQFSVPIVMAIGLTILGLIMLFRSLRRRNTGQTD